MLSSALALWGWMAAAEDSKTDEDVGVGGE